MGSDNTLGGQRATAHLARLGRRRIVFLGDTEAPEATQRYQALAPPLPGHWRVLESVGGATAWTLPPLSGLIAASTVRE